MKPEEKIEQAAKDLGLTIETQFVPWSLSRNRGNKSPSLNWKVTLLRHGKKVLTSDYSKGHGHCPSYVSKPTTDTRNRMNSECETGRAFHFAVGRGAKISITLHEFLYAIFTDAEAINYACFEDWAGDFGYDPDSRKAERDYRICLEYGLALRAAIGDAGISKLRKAMEDY